MTVDQLILALGTLLVGIVTGGLAGLWWGHRRSRELDIKAALLEAGIKTQDQIEKERDEAQERAIEKIRASFDALAGASLRSNSEVFLQLAREHLGQHQQAASSVLAEREKAIESMLQPIKEALANLGKPDLKLMCEPGRALVAQGISLVTQVVIGILCENIILGES